MRGAGAEKVERAGGRLDESEEHTHRGRLAGPVRAEKAENVAARHLHRELIDGEDFAVPLGERLGFYYEVVGCHGRYPTSTRI